MIRTTKLFKEKKILGYTPLILAACAGMIGSEVVFATGVTSSSIGNVASTITQSFTSLTRLITAGSYLAGLGFSIGAIMKFKAHKDNPTQITVGTPIALTFIAAALLFLPTILAVTGGTMFGTTGDTAGPKGTVFGGSDSSK